MALTRRLERKQVTDEDAASDAPHDADASPVSPSAPASVSAGPVPSKGGRVTRSQSGVRTPKRPFTAAPSPGRAKKRRAAAPPVEDDADDADEVPTRPNTPEPAAGGVDAEQTLVAEDTAATLVEGWLPKARRRGRPVPQPVPNLTKKSRGRRVPTAASLGDEEDAAPERSPSPARTYACQVAGCGKLFHRGEHLKRHIRSIHTNEKPFPCPVPNCGKFFSRHDNLLQHKKIHKDDPKGSASADDDDADEPPRTKPRKARKAARSPSPDPDADADGDADSDAEAAPAPAPAPPAPAALQLAYHYQFIPAPAGGLLPPGVFSVPMHAVPAEYPYGAFPVYSFHPPPGTILVGTPLPPHLQPPGGAGLMAVSSVRTGQEEAAPAFGLTPAFAPPPAPVPAPAVQGNVQAVMQAIQSYFSQEAQQQQQPVPVPLPSPAPAPVQEVAAPSGEAPPAQEGMVYLVNQNQQPPMG